MMRGLKSWLRTALRLDDVYVVYLDRRTEHNQVPALIAGVFTYESDAIEFAEYYNKYLTDGLMEAHVTKQITI